MMQGSSFTEQWSGMQKMFLPAAAFQETARHFWDNQEKILNGMQEYADSWFERRRAGTRAARDAADRMQEARSGTDAFLELLQAYQAWGSGAFERVMADGLSLQKQIMALAGLASPPLVPSTSEKEVKPTHSGAKTRTRAEAAS
jgi:hypothetical protein